MFYNSLNVIFFFYIKKHIEMIRLLKSVDKTQLIKVYRSRVQGKNSDRDQWLNPSTAVLVDFSS